MLQKPKINYVIYMELVLFDDYTAGLLKDDKVIDVSDCGVNPNGGASFFGLCRTTSQSREL